MKLETVQISDILIEEAPENSAQQISLLEVGQVDPIRLRRITGGAYGYVIVDGRRRLRDLRAVGAETVEALVEEGGDMATLHLKALILNAGSANELDEARHIRELQEVYSLTLAEIAKITGYSLGKLSTRLRLLKLIPELQRRLRLGELVYSAAVILAKLPEEVQKQHLGEKRITIGAAKEIARTFEAKALNLGAINVPGLEAFGGGPAEPAVTLGPGQVAELVKGESVTVEIGGRVVKLAIVG